MAALVGGLVALLEMALRRSQQIPQRTGVMVFTAALIALVAGGAPLAWALGLGVTLLLGWHVGRWAIRELAGQPGPELRRAIRNTRWGHGR